MVNFSDDFSSNTLDEYTVRQVGSRAGRGSISWDAAGEQLSFHAPDNVDIILSRDDIPFPEEGHVSTRVTVHRDYPVTNRYKIRWFQDDANWIEWQATGSAYGDTLRKRVNDQVEILASGPGTVGPDSQEHTVEADWTASSMTLSVDGEERLSATVDMPSFDLDHFGIIVSQGDADLHAIDVSGGSAATRRSVKATTLTLLPGYNERSEDPDGDELNSSIPDLPILDQSFIADNQLSLPKELDDAIRETRGPFPEYPGEEFKAYRLMNQIELCFDTEDGKTISDWSTAEIAINEVEDPLTGGEWKPSNILVEGETQHGEENPVREVIDRPEYDWFDGKKKLPGDPKQWHDETLEVDVNRVTIGDIEGVRASFIRGARDKFVLEMKRAFLGMGNDPLRWAVAFGGLGMDPAGYGGMMVGPPYFYTFIDLVVMADDSALARVWDASPYPKHYLYVGNWLESESPFEEGTDWEVNQSWNDNERFRATQREQNLPTATPFSPFSPIGYNWYLLSTFPEHPVMFGGRDGEVFTAGDLLGRSELALPHTPW